MSVYASQADIDDLYGTDLLLRIADPNKTGSPDATIVERGLQSADDLINSYVSTRYNLPLSTVPNVLRDCAIDIAVYKIALERARRTEEMRTRYDDWMAWLKDLAVGKVGLGLPPSDLDSNGTVDDQRTNVGRSIDTWRGL